MSTRYPILLVHGIALKSGRIVHAFGQIGNRLRAAGHAVFEADIDGFGAIETNAAQLKENMLRIIEETGAEKVNLICHSKGGLDAKYMILRLGMEEKVASYTSLSTPHRGSGIASGVYRWKMPFVRFLAFWIDLWYRIFGDRQPDALTVCKQLRASPNDEIDGLTELPGGIFAQSYSSRMERGRDDFLMCVPLFFSRRYDKTETDGLVTVESSKFAEYRGDCVEGSASHSEIVGYSLHKEKREKVYEFYLALCADLEKRGL